ncbi:MAG: InlB B-repeat-containing protein, partial [Acutalibacteraceae bacterium]|nr:InlB B-repeat-containing protein [Acutalibacteraceae bacterium]
SQNCQIIARRVTDNDDIGFVVKNDDILPYGTRIIYDITADYGYYLGINGGEIYTTDSCAVTVEGDTSISVPAYAKNFKLNVYTYKNDNPVILYNETVPYNTYFTITAQQPDEGYEFAGWYQANGKLVSTDSEYNVFMTSNISLRAAYRRTSGTVTFIANGQVQKEFTDANYADYYNSFVPSVKYGYEFSNWDKTINEIDTARESGNVTVNAVFVPKANSFTVTINNGESAENEPVTCTESTLITRTAINVDGKTFAYWMKDGVLFTNNPMISFTANETCSIKAVYTDNNATEQIVAEINKVTYVDGELIITANMSVPEGMEIVSVGIRTSSNSDMSEATESTAATSTNPTGFVITKSDVTPNSMLYAQAYVVYKDSNETTLTKPGEIMIITAGQDYDAEEK